MRPDADSRIDRGEEGSALIIALAFLSLFGLAIAAMLAFGDTSYRAEKVVSTQRSDVYAADGAVDAVIGTMRSNLAVGTDIPGSCPDQTVADVNSRTVTVKCSPHVGSGLGGGPGGPADPAVLTLPAAGEYGIHQLSNSVLQVSGDVFTQGNIQQDAGATMNVTGTVQVAQGCNDSTKITASNGLNCSSTTVPGDLGWTAQTPPTTTQSIPACHANTYLALYPGAYLDATALNAWTDGTCTGSVIHFTPGDYYFAFTNAGTHEWLVNDKNDNVVAGTPLGWIAPPTIGNSFVPLRPAVPWPNGCDANAAGVQLIFGGDSRLRIASGGGKVELCGPLAAADPHRVAIFGSKGGASTPITNTPATATSSPAGAFSSPSDGEVIGGNAAQATVTGGNTATFTLSDFGTTNVPAGAQIVSAVLRFAHQETPTSKLANNFPKLTVTKGGSTSTCAAGLTNMSARASMTTDTFTLTSCLTDAAAVNGVSVQYDVKTANPATNSVTAKVDGAALDVTYKYLAPESGCITASGYAGYEAANASTNAGHCPLLSTVGAQANVDVHGSVYAPLAPLDVQLTSFAAQVFERGVTARTLWVSLTPALTFTGSPISAPPATTVPRNDRKVDLTAFLPGDVAPRLTATVTFDDNGGATPGRSVTVSRWTVTR